jgi:hypothetical protein
MASFRSEIDCIKIILEMKRLKREVEVLKRMNIKSNLPEIPPVNLKNSEDNLRMQKYVVEKDGEDLVEEYKEPSFNDSLEQQPLKNLQSICDFKEVLQRKKTHHRKIFPQLNEDSFDFANKNKSCLK